MQSQGRQARLHPQSLDQEQGAQARAEETLVPQWPEMAGAVEEIARIVARLRHDQ
jgi:hypothetical protein